MTDKEFDLYLQDLADAPPPGELGSEFTPWRSAMNRILWGTVWITLVFRLLYLDTILPSIGYGMLLLGYRALRKENRWFSLGYGISWLHLIWWMVVFFLRSTIISSIPRVDEILTILGYAMCVPNFFLLLSLRNGIRTVQTKCGLPPHGGNGILVCHILMVIFSRGNLGDLAAWGLLIAYICIVRSLFTLSKELDEAGYAVCPAPVKISDRTVKGLYAGILAASLVIGFGFLDCFSMDWEPVIPKEGQQVQQIRSDLLMLGFPEQILEDLTEEDLLSCQGASSLQIQADDHPINKGREVGQQVGDSIHITRIYDQKELRLTTIALELPAGKWKVIHHFQWIIDPGFGGTEVIQLWPAYRKEEGWRSHGELTGQVLYDHQGQSYRSPFHSLDHESYSYQSIFWGEQASTDVFAEFSMPNSGQNQRGYVSYTMEALQEGWAINSWINYTHQTLWPRYPAITAKAYAKAAGFGDSLTFVTVQVEANFLPAG